MNIDPTVIVGEAVAGRTATVRRQLKALAENFEKNQFDLGELFYEAQTNGYPQQWGFDSLGDFAQTELGIKHRRAQYLSHIVRVCKEVGVVRADYQPAGVTKLRSITSLDPKGSFFNTETKKSESLTDHIVRLIAEAPENSTVEVEEEVKRLKGQTGENAMLTKSYSVTRSCYENVVQPCFESIRKRLGSAGRDGFEAAREYTDGVVLECLCAEWNADPRNFLEEEDESSAQIEIQEEGSVETCKLTVPSE